MKRISLVALAMAAIAIAVFSAAGGFGIVNLDDYIYVRSHPEVVGGLSLDHLKWAFCWIGDAMWTPLTWASYMLDFSLGLGDGGAHWHNLVLHGASAGLLFLLLLTVFERAERRLSALDLALIAASTLVWAIHPLRVESVVWISSRKDVVSTLFFILALLVWVRARGIAGLLGAIALVIVGGLAKSSVMLFPLFALLIDLGFVSRRRPLWAYAALFVVAAAFATESGTIQKMGGAMDEGVIPLGFRVANAFAASTIYAKNALFPNELAVQCMLRYPYWPRFSILGTAALAALAFWAYRIFRVWRETDALDAREIATFAAVALFFVALGPFLGIVGFGTHAFADRFTILPSIALSLALIGFYRLKTEWRKPLVVVAWAFCGYLACQSTVQTGYWKSDETLFSRTLEIDGDLNMIAHENLAAYHWENGHDLDRVYEHLCALYRVAPWAAEQSAIYSPMLVAAAFETGRTEEAMDAYYWTMRWSKLAVEKARATGNRSIETSQPMLYAEIWRLLSLPDHFENAREKLAEVKRLYPNNYMTLYLEYVIAKKSGERIDETYRALSNSDDLYLKNRWAK